VSSRLVRTPGGRAVAVEITTPLPELEVGHRFAVLGTEIGSSGFKFTGERPGGRRCRRRQRRRADQRGFTGARGARNAPGRTLTARRRGSYGLRG
jgi:hypothetical protein